MATLTTHSTISRRNQRRPNNMPTHFFKDETGIDRAMSDLDYIRHLENENSKLKDEVKELTSALFKTQTRLLKSDYVKPKVDPLRQFLARRHHS